MIKQQIAVIVQHHWKPTTSSKVPPKEGPMKSLCKEIQGVKSQNDPDDQIDTSIYFFIFASLALVWYL